MIPAQGIPRLSLEPDGAYVRDNQNVSLRAQRIPAPAVATVLKKSNSLRASMIRILVFPSIAPALPSTKTLLGRLVK